MITDRTKLFTVLHRAGEVTEHAASGHPTLLPLREWVRFIQAEDQQMLPDVVREW